MVTLIPFSWLGNPDLQIYTSSDINTTTSGPFTSAMEAYWASKALARLAVRDFVAKNNPSFDIIQLLPSVVIGADDRATCLKDLKEQTPLWELKLSPVLGTTQAMPMVGVPVDVADVAKAHVDAINPSVPGGKEYVLSAQTPKGVVWDDMIEIVKKKWPERVGKEGLPLGGTLPSMVWKINVQETEKAFGWEFRRFEDTVKEFVGQYLGFMDAEK
jgi:nucleoside-diphosphate-sugar epimerase